MAGKQYLITNGFIVWEEREGLPAKKIEYRPGMLVDEDEVPQGQSGDVWCSEAHGLAKMVDDDPPRPTS